VGWRGVVLFDSIVAECSPTAVVETGTHLGSTTEYFAATHLPIYSVEYDRRRYGAKIRLWRRRNVHLKRGDSRAGPVLFYLDAHWEADLPLYEELVLIFGRCSDAIVMIDDFSVPFD